MRVEYPVDPTPPEQNFNGKFTWDTTPKQAMQICGKQQERETQLLFVQWSPGSSFVFGFA